MPTRGLFITVEGIDGSGKTTQFNLIRQYLAERNIPYKAVREPGGTEIGEKIRELILDPANTGMTGITEMLLYAASRAQLVREVIEPSLKKGITVLCDRFTDSSLAYQGYGRGLSIETIEKLNEIAAFGIKPDITFLFDIHPQLVQGRMKENSDRIEKERFDFHKNVYNGYHQIAEKDPGRIKIIDCTKSIEEVFAEVKTYLDNILITRPDLFE